MQCPFLYLPGNIYFHTDDFSTVERGNLKMSCQTIDLVEGF
jgi:hypothetical protein